MFKKNPRNPINRTFSFWSLCVAFWSLGYFVWLFTDTYESALFWSRFLMLGAIVIPSAFLHFTFNYLGLTSNRKLRMLILISYTFSALYLALDFTPYFIERVEPRYWFRWWPVPGKLYHFYQLFFIGVVVFTHVLFFRSAAKSKGILRKQLFFVSIGTAIAFTGGSTNFFLWYNIPIPPIFNFLVLGYVCLIFYAVLNYQLWDIKLVVKNTLVFAGLSFFATASIATVFYIISTVFQTAITGISQIWLFMFSGIMIALFIRPLDNWLLQVTDKFLFQKKEDPLILINRLSKEIITMLDLHAVGDKILGTLETALRPKSGALLLIDEAQNQYKNQYTFGLSEKSVLISNKSPFIGYFSSFDKIINLEFTSPKAGFNQEIYSMMSSLSAVLAVPLFFQGKLIGILTLGSKKSDQEYEKRELDVLPTLASQIAIAVSNAKLLDEIVHERQMSIEARRRAELINYTRTLKHESGNKLVGITNAAVNLRNFFSDRLGRFKNKIVDRLSAPEQAMLDELLTMVMKQSQMIESSGQKIESTINSVVGALGGNPSEKQFIEFRVPWETAKRNSDIDHLLNFDVEIEENLKIYGNVDLIERVFENLFTNSHDALKNQEKRMVFFRGSFREVEGKQVAWFEYWDSGPGVPQALFEKVFLQGFSTKPKPASGTAMESGHGFGLYVCKKTIEELHGGKIRLEKRNDGGSKFIFYLPLPAVKEPA